MRTLVVWFVDKLLATVEALIHPEQAAEWEAIKRRNAELDQAHTDLAVRESEFAKRLTESEKRQAASQARIDAADRGLAEDEKKLSEIAQRRKQIADDLAKTEADIDARPDTDRIEQPLPGTAGDRR